MVFLSLNVLKWQALSNHVAIVQKIREKDDVKHGGIKMSRKMVGFCLGLFVIMALVGATMGYIGYMLGYQEGVIDGLEHDDGLEYDENNLEPEPKPENKTWHGKGKKKGWCKP